MPGRAEDRKTCKKRQGNAFFYLALEKNKRSKKHTTSRKKERKSALHGSQFVIEWMVDSDFWSSFWVS